jgi:DNA mismatch endonuclease, patch repair protein
MTARRVPAASSRDALRRMQNTKRRDTKPELALRSELHRRGFRYFVDRAPLPRMRRRADLLFPRFRVAVYVDGCFWHGCPEHGTWPTANADWWRDKIKSNQARDRDTDRALEAAGWIAVRVWEHELPSEAADRVVDALDAARSRAGRC